jgi:ADP-dependent NAD(P)H-hydrate dehydratase / NAD(P)H-hydrate epimerase
MKLLFASQIRSADELTLQEQGLTSLELMERAAYGCAEWVMKRLNRSYSFVIVCGTGNNGGDGLAMARILREHGYSVRVWLLNFASPRSADNASNLSRFREMAPELISQIDDPNKLPEIPQNAFLVDAVFGSGLSRPLKGDFAKLISALNELPAQRIAIDIPSGLSCDALPSSSDTVFRANHTLCIQQYKRSFLHPEGGSITGEVHLIDIGLSKTAFQQAETPFHTQSRPEIMPLHRFRSDFAHKGSCGHTLLAAGSRNMMGAAILSGKAVLRSGAGKVSVWIPSGSQLLHQSIPEALVVTDDAQSHFNSTFEMPDFSGFQAIGIGPGIGTHPETISWFEHVLRKVNCPLVLDADALNILAKRPDLMPKLPKNTIMTPHPGEFRRLFGEYPDSMKAADKSLELAVRHQLIIVLKGRYTTISCPDGNQFYNLSGNSGMATAGSGDVLTGVITGLLAQGYPPADAARLGVYLHGHAGDLALQFGSRESLIASDIIQYLGAAFRYVTRY